MNQETLTRLLSRVASGDVSVDDAKDKFKHLAFEDIGFAHIDHHRSLRKGFPEVIFGEGKTTAQIHGILDKMADREPVILVTRIDPEKAAPILEDFPQAAYFADARLLRIQNKTPEETGRGTILIVSAATSDIPVASEAELTAAAMGNQVQTLFDVGVAGIHRLFAHREALAAASVIIVVAGMEGALPSVVAGMVKAPVIAVPTSIGYGTSFNGMTALLGMLNSCSFKHRCGEYRQWLWRRDNGFGHQPCGLGRIKAYSSCLKDRASSFPRIQAQHLA